METKPQPEKEQSVINLSEITNYSAFIICVGLTYSVVRFYFYYVILLHIPIFQYVDTADMVLSFSTAIFLTLYAAPLFVANEIGQSELFTIKEKFFYRAVLYLFVGFLFLLGKQNDPIVAQFYLLPLKYWLYGIIPFVIYIYVVLTGTFFKKNAYIAIFIFALWFGIFESFANYEVLTTNVKNLHLLMKLKDGQIIKTNKSLVYAGRTKEYWFFYSTKKHLVRAIKNEDVSIVDYDIFLR